MQVLEPGLYEAKWGCYRMVALISEGHRSCGELIFCDGGAETSVLKCVNTDAVGLIKNFVEYIEQHLGVAIVDGRKSSIADFLVFVKMEKVLH